MGIAARHLLPSLQACPKAFRAIRSLKRPVETSKICHTWSGMDVVRRWARAGLISRADFAYGYVRNAIVIPAARSNRQPCCMPLERPQEKGE